MKKRKIIIPAILICVALIVVYINTNAAASMGNLGLYRMLHSEASYEKKLESVKAMIDEQSMEELLDLYQGLITEWKEKQRRYDIDRVDVTAQNRSNKVYNNLELTVDIRLNQEDEISKKRMYDEIEKLLLETPYGYYKISFIKMNLYRSIDIETPYASREREVIWTSETERKVFVVQ